MFKHTTYMSDILLRSMYVMFRSLLLEEYFITKLIVRRLADSGYERMHVHEMHIFLNIESWALELSCNNQLEMEVNFISCDW
jgi:hypothetical protein